MDLTKKRVILHCDMNGFFASVELLDYPELRDKPMAVCGDPESRHGIILAKTEIAKRYGIVTAETLWRPEKNARICKLFRPITRNISITADLSMKSICSTPIW